MNEKETVDRLNKEGTNLTLVKGKFNSYDAEDNNYIVEIKNRREYYSEKLIEAFKLFKNFQMSQILNKSFLYVVTDSKGLYIYNISKDIDKILSKPIKAIKCPKSTDFKNKEKIIKYSYTLNEDIATKLEL
jgi:hypothetical protein